MEYYWILSSILLFISIRSTLAQFSVYDQTIIPFSIYNTDGNPNNIITNSKIFRIKQFLLGKIFI